MVKGSASGDARMLLRECVVWCSRICWSARTRTTRSFCVFFLKIVLEGLGMVFDLIVLLSR